MPRLLRMPGVSANATEAVLAEWLVAESGEFGVADALATVETDKALVDVEADAAGVVLKTLVAPGSQVKVGSPIAVLGGVGEQVDDLAALLRDLGVAEAPDAVVPERRDVPKQPVSRAQPDVDPESAAPLAEATAPEVQPPAEPTDASSAGPAGSSESRAVDPPRPPGRTFASPLARKLARAAGLVIEDIPGTGPRQRVLRRDVEALLALRQSAPAPTPVVSEVPTATSAAYDEVPHSRLRRAVVERLVQSKQQAPHFYVRATVRVERLVALRGELNEALEGGTKVSLNDLVVKAVAIAHHRVPDLNATWTDHAVRRWHVADIAVAVATDRGLVTPVVRDAGSRSVVQVAQAVRDLADRAREGRLRQEELEGGSITVSNLGMFGVEEFAAIINPPHAAILAVGALREEPVVENGAVVPGSVMRLTLSVDHRPADGTVAARWMRELTGLLERPLRLLTD